MVRFEEPVLPPPLVELLLELLPHAATPKARATVRQLEAATERTRKIPSSGNGHQSGAEPIPRVRHGATPAPLSRDYQFRLPGRYGAMMCMVAPTTMITTVIMKASNALTLIAHRTIQTTKPNTVV